MAKLLSKRIRKSFINPIHRGINFPRQALTKAVADSDKDFREPNPPFRVVAWGVPTQALRLLTETRFFLEGDDVFGRSTSYLEDHFNGWAFDREEDTQEFFRILKRFSGVSCWFVEVHRDD